MALRAAMPAEMREAVSRVRRPQVFARRAVVEGDRGDAAGHRFQGHVAEGVAAAREHEQVAACKMPGDISTGKT